MNWATTSANAVLLALITVFPLCGAFAQDKQYTSYKVAAADTKYTKQQTIDVGDVPGHQLRIYEIERQFPKDGPVIAGLRLVRQVDRAFSDYANFKGPAIVYGIWEFENGDKFYARGDQVTESTPNSDGSLTAISHRISKITGGTGKLHDLRGTLTALTRLDTSKGLNDTQVDIEYWTDK